MPLTLESFAAEMQPFHNDICIVHDICLGRLVGVCETDDDFYYIVQLLHDKAPSYYSAVGPCISLKPTYPADDYDRLDQVFALNSAAPADDFLVTQKI